MMMDRHHMLSNQTRSGRVNSASGRAPSSQTQTMAKLALGSVQPFLPLQLPPLIPGAHSTRAAAPSQHFGPPDKAQIQMQTQMQTQMQMRTHSQSPSQPPSHSHPQSQSRPHSQPQPSSQSQSPSPLPPPSYSQIAASSSSSSSSFSSASPSMQIQQQHSSEPTFAKSTTATANRADTGYLPSPFNRDYHDHFNNRSRHSNDTRDDRSLPSLSSITGDLSFNRPKTLPPPQWSAFNTPSNSSISTNTTVSHRPSPMYPPDSPAATAMDVERAASVLSSSSPDRHYEGTPTPSSVTLDDPDVRLAAEALGDLRADFVSSPPDTSASSFTPINPHAPTYGSKSRKSSRPRSPKPEPLLSLLTTAHPFVASTIGGASSVYGGAKNFSPRFKSSAEYVEGYLTPIANTVNSVGRATGVEGGVRWILGNRRRATGSTSDPESCGSSKRRKTGECGDARDSPEMSAYDDFAATAAFRTPRRLSSASTVDTLPAYDDQRSPAYTEEASAHNQKPASKNQPWQTRLIMSTSGLSIAMSAESLRSLKYCLLWLRWANDHLIQVVSSLRHALEEYEKAAGRSGEDQRMDVDSEAQRERTPQQSRTEIAARIHSLKGDILKTLQDIIQKVSKYTGGALPDNARDLVRRHLTSLPQRFRLATMSEKQGENQGNQDSALEEGAQKVLVLAKEGLDMLAQVGAVLDGTIVNAEQWCERMGKKTGGEEQSEMEGEQSQPQYQQRMESNGDVKMG